MADYDTLTLTAEIVASYLAGEHHRVTPAEIPELIRAVRSALEEAPEGASPVTTEASFPKPSKREIAKSITPEALVSFVDGKPYKTLKRHLSRHGMDLGAYRERFGLPSDYPSVAPSYSAARSAMAKSLGLGALRRGTGGSKPPAAAKPAGAARKKAPAATE